MSDHYYGIVHIEGPNADAAEKSARDMTKDVPDDIPTDQMTPEQAKLPWVLDEKAPDGSWACAQWRLSGPGFFTWQKWGGRKTVEFVQKLSTKYPNETFIVQICGPYASESFQGVLKVKDGIISDVHTDCPWCGYCLDEKTNVRFTNYFSDRNTGETADRILWEARGCGCDTPPSRGALV